MKRVSVAQYEALLDADRGPLRRGAGGWSHNGSHGKPTATVDVLVRRGFLVKQPHPERPALIRLAITDAGRGELRLCNKAIGSTI